MLRTLGILVCGLMIGVADAGELEPPGAPSSTANLAEPRIPIAVSEELAFPITITQEGPHYLTRNLTVPTSTNGIVIAADNVTLDLEGFTVSSTPTEGPIAHGILSAAKRNVTVRNGIIRGFNAGINLDSGNGVCLVEDMIVDQCRVYGISAWGDQGAVRDCHVTEIGGTTDPSATRITGIVVFGDGMVIEHNVVSHIFSAGTQVSYGIWGASPNGGYVTLNRVFNSDFGLFLSVDTGYRENFAFNCDTPFFSGVDLGNNFSGIDLGISP